MGKYDLVEGIVLKEDAALPFKPVNRYVMAHGVKVDDVMSYVKPGNFLGVFRH